MLACGGHSWMSSIFLNYFPLSTDPAAHWLARLSSKSQGCKHLCFPLSLPASRYRHVPPWLAFLWVQGIQNQVLMLAWQACYWLNHLSHPSIVVFSVSATQCGLWIFHLGRVYVLVGLIWLRLVRKSGHSGWVQEKRCLWSPIRQRLHQPCWIQDL